MNETMLSIAQDHIPRKELVARSPYDPLLHPTQDTCEAHRTVVRDAMETTVLVDGYHFGFIPFGGHYNCDSHLKESPDGLTDEWCK